MRSMARCSKRSHFSETCFSASFSSACARLLRVLHRPLGLALRALEHLVGLFFCVGQKRVALLLSGLRHGVHIGGCGADGKQILIRRGLRGLQNAADLDGGLRDGAGVFDVQLLFVQRGLERFDLRGVLLILLLKLVDDVDELHPARIASIPCLSWLCTNPLYSESKNGKQRLYDRLVDRVERPVVAGELSAQHTDGCVDAPVDHVCDQNAAVMALGDVKALVERVHERFERPVVWNAARGDGLRVVFGMVKRPVEERPIRVGGQVAPIGGPERAAVDVDFFQLVSVGRIVLQEAGRSAPISASMAR